MKEFITKDVTKRNALIEKLYWRGIKYSYTRADSSGNYHVKYPDDVEIEVD